ncbi:MAG: hypothetical protein ACK5LG_22160 [Bacteroides thetaiotaomicron]
MRRTGGSNTLVVRCPMSETATSTSKSCGKGCVKNVTSATSEGNQIRDSPYDH